MGHSINSVKLVAVFAENKPGQVARITQILANANINIHCVTVASSGAYGVMKVVVNQPDLAHLALRHEGFAATLLDAVAVEMADNPGALHTVADCLAQHGVNLENTSGFVANHRAILVIEAQNVTRASEVLQGSGLHVLSQKEMLSL